MPVVVEGEGPPRSFELHAVDVFRVVLLEEGLEPALPLNVAGRQGSIVVQSKLCKEWVVARRFDLPPLFYDSVLPLEQRG